MPKVFYSWQSDLPNATNRTFIEAALTKAIKRINDQGRDGVELVVLDRDTANVSGAPEIASTIFDKIDDAHVFVADVTTVLKNGRGKSKRAAPNPNVLLELGYAGRSLGWERVICIANLAFGKLQDLPFDLRGRRVSTYTMAEACEDRKPERDVLVRTLEAALQPLIQSSAPTRRMEREELALKKLRAEAQQIDLARQQVFKARVDDVLQEEMDGRPNWFGVLVVPARELEPLEFGGVDARTLGADDLVHDRRVQFQHLVVRDDAYQSFLPFDREPKEAHYLLKLRRDAVIHLGTDGVVADDGRQVWWPSLVARECVDAVRIARCAWASLGLSGAAVAVVQFATDGDLRLPERDDPAYNGVPTVLAPGKRRIPLEMPVGPDDGVRLAKLVLDRLYQEHRYNACPFFDSSGRFSAEFAARLR